MSLTIIHLKLNEIIKLYPNNLIIIIQELPKDIAKIIINYVKYFCKYHLNTEITNIYRYLFTENKSNSKLNKKNDDSNELSCELCYTSCDLCERLYDSENIFLCPICFRFYCINCMSYLNKYNCGKCAQKTSIDSNDDNNEYDEYNEYDECNDYNKI